MGTVEINFRTNTIQVYKYMNKYMDKKAKKWAINKQSQLTALIWLLLQHAVQASAQERELKL